MRGNTSYIKLVHEALDNYIAQRDVRMLLGTLEKNMLDILNFAYEASRNYPNYLEIIDKIPVIRMYHEITICEEKLRDELAKVVDSVSISLNAPTAEKYQEVTRPQFENAFDAMLDFASEAKGVFEHTQLSIVDVLPAEEIAECQRIADERGVYLKIRKFA